MTRTLFFILCLLCVAPAAWAQSASSGAPPEEEQNETMRDTLKRMQIKREESEHKKLLEKGEQIKLEAENLAKAAAGSHLPRPVEKKLREIEKSARQIRSDFGGAGDDNALESPPNNLDDALKQLSDASERLNKHLSKTSRRVVSITVIEVTNEITQLVKILRGYLN
ncbi:MAG: hypothetical protein ACREBD_13525 [Blastocatellia bacterium]